MEEKIKTIIVIIGILIGGIFIWQSIQNAVKTERQYQACLRKCEARKVLEYYITATGERIFPKYKACVFECQEKYAKQNGAAVIQTLEKHRAPEEQRRNIDIEPLPTPPALQRFLEPRQPRTF
jgi:hypothetical protein